MGNTNGGKFPRRLYNLNVMRTKSGTKPKKALERYIDLLKKEEAQGNTKWIYKTKLQATARLKKYGISLDTVRTHLEKKWLTNLATKLSA